jgi:hypothetical protein
MTRRELIFQGPRYFSRGDENAFFHWLQSVPCVGEVRGHQRNLHVGLKQPVSVDDLRELGALFRRYHIDVEPLKALHTSRNAKWFADQARWKVGSSDGD